MIHSEAPHLHILSAASLFTAALFPVAPKVMTKKQYYLLLSLYLHV